jgi:hypothetical protein
MALAPRQRTKDALAMKRAEGVRLGRPPAITGCVAERIMREGNAGSDRGAAHRGRRPNTSWREGVAAFLA